MKNITLGSVIWFTALLACSCKFSGSDFHLVVEAEDMDLLNYRVDSNASTVFIKLADTTGMAGLSFPGPTGLYDIDVRYLSESIGQNTYGMYVADNQIVAWLGKDRDDQWHMLSEQKWHAPRDIAISKGDEIRVEALSENGSLVVFDYIEFRASGNLPAMATETTELIKERRQKPSDIGERELSPNMVRIRPEEYENAIRNPLKGFRPNTIYSGIQGRTSEFDPTSHVHEYGLLIKIYFKWNELESNAGDGVDKIREVCNERWRGVESLNVKIIPRVYLEWPNRESGWPEDMKVGDFTSQQFEERVLALIDKLGKAWDNDPRVAYVEMGLIGEWGEMEWPDTKDEIKEAIAARFATAFNNKLVMIRWPKTYNDHLHNFGYYWDSYAHHDQEYYAFHLNNTAPRWKTAVIGGEVAYNWGNVHIQPGRNPDESLREPVHRDFVLDKIRKLHANHLGWIANYDHSDDAVRAGAAMVQKALGYRFVISEVSYPKIISPGSRFRISFEVRNTGSSPFYYNWPVELSLLDANTRQPVWKQHFTDTDIRSWMPGDQWDESTDAYLIPAEIYTISQEFQIEDIPAEEYILALAILDPAGNRPAARFAIKNYYTGGRHPIGRIGVGQTPASFELEEFDDILSDLSLSYDVVLER